MGTQFQRLAIWFENLPDALRRKRYWVWAGFFLFMLVMLPGLVKFEMDFSDEQFFRQQDPIRRAYDAFRAQFGGDESLFIIYRAKDGDVFSEKSLQAVHDLQEELLNYRLQLQAGQTSPLDHMVDVTTIANVSYLQAADDALISRPFIGHKIPQTAQEREALRKSALEHPEYPLFYISKDGKTFSGIFIRTDFKAVPAAVDDFNGTAVFDVTLATEMLAENAEEETPYFPTQQMSEYADFVHAMNAIINQPKYTDVLEYFPMGNPIFNAYMLDELLPQMYSIMMVMLLLIMLIQWLLFRSLAAVLWPQIIIGCSAILVLATLGWLDLRLNMMINVVILMVLAVGVADAIHILSGYMFFRDKGLDHPQAMRATYRKSGLAILLTSITTGTGMLALLLVPLVPIQLFGFSAALGVFFALGMSILVLPLMLDIWAPVPKKEKRNGRIHVIQWILRRIEHWGYRRPTLNITVFTVVTLVLLVGVLQVRVDSNFIEIFKKDTPIRVAQEVAEQHMGGNMVLEIMLRAKTDGAMRDPAMLNAMDQMHQWLLTDFNGVITKTKSLVDVVKQSNKSLNGGKEEFYAIPQDPQVLRQTLFMFSNANPRDRRRMVSDDYREAHITVVFRNQGTRQYTKLLQRIEHKMESVFAPLKVTYPNLSMTPTGGLTMIVKVIDYISWSQIYGFAMALTAISIILFFTFRSVRVGLIALFPNLFPIVTVFGLMGYLGISVDVDTLLVAPVMIGIVVDDTIHFLTHYRALVENHGDIDLAIRDSFREVGQAITFTTLILAGAFVSFMFLDHQGLKNFGGLAAIAMFAALAGDLLMLPALLKASRIRFIQTDKIKPAPASV